MNILFQMAQEARNTIMRECVTSALRLDRFTLGWAHRFYAPANSLRKFMKKSCLISGQRRFVDLSVPAYGFMQS